MSRLTGTDAKNLMEAYSEVYASQEELAEEQVWEEVETWVNSLVEEGYDLSEYTWEEMYEAYIEEQGRGGARPTTFQNTGGYGRYTSPKQQRAAITATANEKMFKAGGGNAAIPQSARRNTRGGGQTIDPAAMEKVRQQGFQNLMRQRQQAPAAQPPAPQRPAAPAAPAKPVTSAAPTKPVASASTGTQKPVPTSTSKPSTSTPAAPARPSLASQAAELRQMRARSLERQGKPLSAAAVSATAKPAAFQANSFDPFYEYEPYDLVLEYLLSEGHVETLDEALYVMMEMDSETIQSICEAAADQSDKQINQGVKTTYKAGNVLDNQHQGRSRGLNRLSATERAAKVERMRKRLKARRDDLFGERNRREDATREEMRRKYGL